jgi:hypothetical protein
MLTGHPERAGSRTLILLTGKLIAVYHHYG